MSLASALLSFGALVVVMTLVPGLDTAVVLRGTLARSRSYGLATTLGIMTGLVIWGAVAGAGAAAILTASRAAYRALALAGALYLAWMGASMLWRAWHSRGRTGSRAGLGQEGRSHDGGASPGAPLWRGWLTGMWTDLLNPKAGVFHLATIPQFMVDGVPPLVMGVLLACVHAACTMLWLGGLTMGASWLAPRLSGSGAERSIGGPTQSPGRCSSVSARLALDARL